MHLQLEIDELILDTLPVNISVLDVAMVCPADCTLIMDVLLSEEIKHFDILLSAV